MDNSSCAVVYLDRRARATGCLTDKLPQHHEEEDATYNTNTILSAFGEVFVYSDGIACLNEIAHLEESRNPSPIIVLLDMPSEDETSSRKSSWDSRNPPLVADRRSRAEDVDLYGMQMLNYLASDMQRRARSRLIICVAVLRSKFSLTVETTRMSRFLDAGAVDVLTAPITADRLQALAVHAYRRAKEVSREESSFALTKRNRKLSWVGIAEEQPYAYLREVMVSGLMNGICNPETVGENLDISDLNIDPARKHVIAVAVGSWSFSAHDFDPDELLYAALVILKHALDMPELEKWRMPTDDLTTFLMACRRAYNDFVLYHNFTHVVDVLQAVFYFLLKIGILPPYQVSPTDTEAGSSTSKTPLTPGATGLAPAASLLKPFDALTLLISAIGHDVGHPGVNNAFLVALNAPLAQLYNDRSVLEAFHCAAYSQILRRYWPQAFADTGMRKLMINSILATDMGLHFYYIADMSNLEENLASNPIEKQTQKDLDTMRDLCCGLLIKCADISNVARKYMVAKKWARILTEEFSNQGAMEQELELPTCLFGGPPDLTDGIKMAEGQIAFMKSFAMPLFSGVSRILPAMDFGVAEMENNQLAWQKHIEKLRKSAFEASTDEDVEQQEAEGLPPLMMERDSLMAPHTEDEYTKKSSTESQPRTPCDTMSSAERRLRNTSMGSLSPVKSSHRKKSNSGSFHGPFSLPFAQQHSGSRRSSKDAALDQLEHMHLNTFTRLENQSADGGRRGSADASLTTIVVRSQTPRNDHRPTSQPSPNKRYPRSSSQPSHAGNGSSLPSSHSNATSNTMATTNAPRSPSTQASSLNDVECKVMELGEPSASAMSSTHLSPGLPTPEQRQTLSAPDIFAVPGMPNSSKTNLGPHYGKEGSEEGDDSSRLGRHLGIRQSRSHSRLRGLRFWKKRWKSPSGAEVEHSE